MAGHAGHTVAHHLLAHLGPQAIGTDQGAALNPRTVGQAGFHAAIGVRIGHDFAVGAQFDQRIVLATAQHDAVQFAAVHDGIGIAEPFAERRVERDRADFLGTDGIHQQQLVDIDRSGARFLSNAQVVEGVEGIGAKLNAGTDFAQDRRAFQDHRRDALLGKSQRSGEAPDAAARY